MNKEFPSGSLVGLHCQLAVHLSLSSLGLLLTKLNCRCGLWWLAMLLQACKKWPMIPYLLHLWLYVGQFCCYGCWLLPVHQQQGVIGFSSVFGVLVRALNWVVFYEPLASSIFQSGPQLVKLVAIFFKQKYQRVVLANFATNILKLTFNLENLGAVAPCIRGNFLPCLCNPPVLGCLQWSSSIDWHT